MFIILCEDSEMGYEFWSKLNYFCLDKKAKVISSKGVDNMLLKLKSLTLTSKDTVLFAIDNIGDRKVRDILRGLRDDINTRGYSCKVTGYYCIEEIFLSFSEFGDWVHLPKEVKNEIYNPIYNFLVGNSIEDYSKVQKYHDLFPNSEINNREQLANKLLNELSGKYRTGFWIHKNRYSNCWYSDCVHGEGVPFRCKKEKNNFECFLYKQGYNFTSKEKLEYFWKNSNLQRLVCPLDVLRKKI